MPPPRYARPISAPLLTGLLKLVFATETLAAGINMPARTTLISALSRRRDGGIGPLAHNELLQMAGRAGRRGYDTSGNCVILQVRWRQARWARQAAPHAEAFALRGPQPAGPLLVLPTTT